MQQIVFLSCEAALLQTAYPRPDENFAGYLLRLVEANSYNSIRVLLDLAPLSPSKDPKILNWSQNSDLEQLSALTGVATAKFRDLLHPIKIVGKSRFHSVYTLPDSELPTYLLRANGPRICPRCLAEDPYVRKTWDFAPITVCVRHACLLLDTCPGCRERLSWYRREVCRCPCGYDWRQAPADVVEDRRYLAVSYHAHRFLNPSAPVLERADQTDDNPAFGLSLAVFLRSLYFVAAHWDLDLDARGIQLIKNYSTAELHKVLAHALDVFAAWPHNLHAFLSAIRGRIKRAAGEANGRLSAEFHNFNRIRCERCFADLDLLRTGFEEYIASHAPPFSALLSTRGDEKSRYVSKNWAIKAGLARPALKTLLKSGNMNCELKMQPHTGRTQYFFERVEVLSEIAGIQAMLTIT